MDREKAEQAGKLAQDIRRYEKITANINGSYSDDWTLVNSKKGVSVPLTDHEINDINRMIWEKKRAAEEKLEKL